MFKPVRILLADDHPLFREGVAASLAVSPEFVIIFQARSGEEALERSMQLRPDMVLLDVSMAGMGGIAAAAQIAVNLPATRIMMLTVSENRENLLAALKAGAHGYVLKGVSASELRSAVASVASGEAYVTPALAAEMLTAFSRPSAPDTFSGLTSRESGVLNLLSQGLSNREIGERLHLAEKTVKHHMSAILQKLQVRTRTEAALMAAQYTARQP
ncbi:response regulator transcription factor [Rhodoferax sp.]|uniref:response regulator n=1 Tax=Rhodoferax sp. TaxID=50421 RepID=UPI0008C4DAAA|nr:response regulator transcription factor [Rhodoferax sp.]MDO8320795.1 response regulator transcription factor [Rhodoferax sp.]OGB53598.1 MAG: DNA-binding response regulator [Burkholderiales bacterium RIFOXYD12_FULL_59_19]OGB74484.1 MAG: DNA-binding response regulator [Burkholderiales bacterium RIFOXYC12_FULL_60_6]OGB86157.1 MAG: DNA-binding response regulator [Burkholderiales bacterium RIFOXYD2_FULL_59_8]